MSYITDNFDTAKQDTGKRYYLRPERVVWFTQGAGQISAHNNLLADDLHICTITPSKYLPPSILLDYGSEFNGGIQIHLANPGPQPILKARIRFGESVSEAMGSPDNDHSIHDFTAEMSVMGKHQFGNTGFRFVRIDFIECREPVDVAAIELAAIERDYIYRGEFASSDELLNKIWKTGARTVHLCCQEYILDGIKRDRLLWVGDLHPQIDVISNVFGDVDIVEKTLTRAARTTPPDEWMNGFCVYSLWWIVCLYDRYLYTGKMCSLQEQERYLKDLVDNIISHIDDNGNEHLSGHRFMDWVIGFNEEVLKDGIHAIVMLALQKALKIFNALESEQYCEMISDILRRMQAVELDLSDCKQVNSMLALAGIITPQEANSHSLAIDSDRGLSTWFAYYALEVRAAAGDIEGSLDMIRSFWGGMLRLGATTFWEHFDVDWLKNAGRVDQLPQEGLVDVHLEKGDHCFKGLRHSLCHGWAGGVTAWLSRYVIGVRPASPGFKTVYIRPNLGNLDFVKGKVPTPYGDIEVEASKDGNGNVKVKSRLPNGITEIEKTIAR
jgi:alpha-L-rhamnosidase